MAEFRSNCFPRKYRRACRSAPRAISGRLVSKAQNEADWSFRLPRPFATPRRLTLVVDGLPEKQPDVDVEERRGVGRRARESDKGFKRSFAVTALKSKRRDR